ARTACSAGRPRFRSGKRAQREPKSLSPAGSARLRIHGSLGTSFQVTFVGEQTAVAASQSVRFWGCGGWEAAPSRTVTHSPASEEPSGASTASEGSGPNHDEDTKDPRRPRRHVANVRHVARGRIV